MEQTWTLRETASYLKITEESLTSWVNTGIIPVAAGDDTFDPNTIEKWKQNQTRAHQIQGPGDGSFSIEQILEPDRLIFSDEISKENLFECLAKQAVENDLAASKQDILNDLWNREALMSTGIGLGLAVPHLRLTQLSSIELFLLFNQSPISDYDTIDGEPVNLIAFVLVGKHMHKEYLKTLASVVRLLKNDDVRTAALACKDTQSAYAVITGKF